jgi:hypothetical protein
MESNGMQPNGETHALIQKALSTQAERHWARAEELWARLYALTAEALAATPHDRTLEERARFIEKQRTIIRRSLSPRLTNLDDGETSFTVMEAFPHVSRVIDKKFDADEHPWVEYFEIQEGLLEDRQAREDVKQWAEAKGRTPREIAVAVQSLWARAFTVSGEPDPTERYEQRTDGNAYRPRRAKNAN